MKFQNIAVFIDAENFSHTLVDEAFLGINKLGKVGKAFAYGDFSLPSLKSYKDVILNHNIFAMQNFSYASGKNSSDIALAIDAMELLCSGEFDAFVIVSNDSDFIRLAQKIRSHGKTAICVATNAKNERAYDEILLINKKSKIRQNIENGVKSLIGIKPQNQSTQQPKNLNEAREILTKFYDEMVTNSNQNEFIHQSLFGSAIKDGSVKFSLQEYGFSRLGKFFDALAGQNIVEIMMDGSAPKFRMKR
ncbi:MULTISPECIES: NYN domain-containing protein [unclassified Campylobacter]|uniref:NYN domain-containing protein n=1 Tax=unclassified Campylobacter TaxID=2593542 RepID=UPI003D338279